MTESEKMTVARAVELLREYDSWSGEVNESIKTVCDALEWRPIETAPMDDYFVCQVLFDGKSAMGLYHKGAWSVSALKWLDSEGDRFVWVDHQATPTHWRPYPEVV